MISLNVDQFGGHCVLNNSVIMSKCHEGKKKKTSENSGFVGSLCQ